MFTFIENWKARRKQRELDDFERTRMKCPVCKSVNFAETHASRWGFQYYECENKHEFYLDVGDNWGM